MAHRNELKRSKKKQKKKDFTPFIIIGVLVLVVVVVIVLTSLNANRTPENPNLAEVVDPELAIASTTDGLTMGDPNAPVKVIEFADYQCPGCGSYWATLEPQIIADYVNTGKVFFTFSPFSFVGSFVENNPWDESIKSAEAAYCANEVGKFWEYRSYLFGNQQGENQGAFSRNRLIEMADRLSLDKKAFTECLDSGKYNQTVLDANDYAVENGISYTPSFLINGQIVGGGDVLAAIETAVNE